MSRLAVAVIEGEESRIRETVGKEVELKLEEGERRRGGGEETRRGKRREVCRTIWHTPGKALETREFL